MGAGSEQHGQRDKVSTSSHSYAAVRTRWLVSPSAPIIMWGSAARCARGAHVVQSLAGEASPHTGSGGREQAAVAGRGTRGSVEVAQQIHRAAMVPSCKDACHPDKPLRPEQHKIVRSWRVQ